MAERRLVDAAKAYAGILESEPKCLEALAQLGHLLFQFNQNEEALSCVQQALAVAARTPKLNLLAAAILRRLGRLEESVDACRRETVICPSDADAFYNLSLVLSGLGRAAEAAEAARQAAKLRPDYAEAWLALGVSLRLSGAFEESLEVLEKLVVRQPGSAEAHWELCCTLLALGQYERGWKEYEWRWKLKDFTTPPAPFSQPLWDGSDLQGRRILLHCEQGYGDMLQFSRYATLVARRNGHVILGCPAVLKDVLSTIPGVSEVATNRAALPPFDLHVPLLSLPALLGTTLESIPAEVPYVQAPAREAGKAPWIKPAAGLNVGLVWSGDTANRSNHHRLLPLSQCASLLSRPGVNWYSLQVGKVAEALKAPEFAGKIEDLGSRFRNFGDTAQAICELDLLITVDTSVAHLAGALGRRVWTLLSFEAEWRWLARREDSPWYPGMRLFRQKASGAWPEVLQRVAAELDRLIGGRGL
jgi:tetratricopeptide (TPR) repeat protein